MAKSTIDFLGQRTEFLVVDDRVEPSPADVVWRAILSILGSQALNIVEKEAMASAIINEHPRYFPNL